MGWRSGQSYSQDLRGRVLGAVDGGMAVRQAAVTFQVSIAYIYKALIRRRLTGDAGISPNRGRPPRKLSPEQELALAAHIRSRPGITLAQARAWLLAEHGIAARRKLWKAAQPFIDPESLVFLDETGVNTKMARLYGWAPVGERCRDYSPDMNPIEMAFSKLKALLRQEPARTIDGLVERIGNLLDRFLPAECANFFEAAGYQRSS